MFWQIKAETEQYFGKKTLPGKMNKFGFKVGFDAGGDVFRGSVCCLEAFLFSLKDLFRELIQSFICYY